METTVKKVAILGGGMWGRTIGLLLSRNDLQIAVWDIRESLRIELDEFYKSMSESGHKIISTPVFEFTFSKAIDQSDIAIIALPTHAVRDISAKIAESGVNPYIIIATKGIDEFNGAFHLMTDVVTSAFGDDSRVGVLSGPNLSLEIQARQPAVTIVASSNEVLINSAMKLLSSEVFRVYGSTDIRGVQIGGTVKNVIALASGMVDELRFEFNTKAALLTRGLSEITRLGEKMGAERKTLSGISGLGDLICTAFSPTSRNYRAGRLFGKGMKRNEIITDIGQVIEGIENSRTVFHLAENLGVEMPISKGVYGVVWEDQNPMDTIKDLMSRSLKFE